MKIFFWILGLCALLAVAAIFAINLIEPPPITVTTRNTGHTLTLPRSPIQKTWFVILAPVRISGLPDRCYVLLYKNRDAWLLNPDDGWDDRDFPALIDKLKDQSATNAAAHLTFLLKRVAEEKERVKGKEPLRAMVLDVIQTNEVRAGQPSNAIR